MKRGMLLSASVLAIVPAAGAPARAQDPIEVGKGVYTLVFENERVRVSDVKFAPGAKVPAHAHPEYVLYVLAGGTLAISRPEAETTEFTGTPGQVVYMPAETHWAENVGTTEFHAIVVELKDTSDPNAGEAHQHHPDETHDDHGHGHGGGGRGK